MKNLNLNLVEQNCHDVKNNNKIIDSLEKL